MRRNGFFLLILCWQAGIPILAQEFKPIDASQKQRQLAADIFQDNLSRELGSAEFRSDARHTDRKEISIFGKKIVNEITFIGWFSIKCEEPKSKLTVDVTELKQVKQNEIHLTTIATCPVTGHVHAGIEKGPSAGSDATAKIKISVSWRVTWKSVDGINEYIPELTKLEANIEGLRLQHPILNLFSGMGQKAINDWASTNNGVLHNKANDALRKAIKEKKITGTFDGFILSN